ncbi:MAG TPA: cytochrome c3 family protein [Chthoniobacterales bacterium]|nr:cytochrome c3 family protein [Chthoniobacterales bacterium]
MAAPRKTNKQLSEKYKDNLANYRRLYTGRRKLLAVTLLAIFGGAAAVFYYSRHAPEKFFNPGPVSSHHRNITRAMIGDLPPEAISGGEFSQNCDACHDKSLISGGQMDRRTLGQVLRDSFTRGAAADRITRIDDRCEKCHARLSQRTHTFHEPNAIQHRCSVCHQEHRGPGPMKLVASSECASCHGDAEKMRLAAQTKVPPDWSAERRHPQQPQRVIFNQLGRPPEGYTKTFANFWTDHPEFRINLAKAADPTKVRDPDSYVAADGLHDILRFNHSRHFRPDIPAVDKTGRKLDCNYCHQLETEGRFMKRISFQANCQACHQLQFDLNNPDLTLPHGDPTAVLGFLRSATSHYEDLARRKGITDPGKVRAFVEQQRRGLRAQYTSDQQLINSVFFEADPFKIRPNVPRSKGANFAGCAYCHQVTPAAVGAPAITKPILVDRWMLLSDFDHAKHIAVKGVDCDSCHQIARGSTKSSDILLPVKDSCVKCHSPHAEPGMRTAAECITCHDYHAKSVPTATARNGSKLSLKEMMLAKSR